MTNEVKKTFSLPKGGKVTVTVQSAEAIDERTCQGLKEPTAIRMAQALISIADGISGKRVN